MDIRTLLFADLVLQICCASGLLMMSRSVPGLKGLRWFAWSYVSASVGILMAMVASYSAAGPGAWALVVGRCLVMLGAVLMVQGISEFVVRSAHTLGWGGLFLLLYLIADAYTTRMASAVIPGVVIFCVAFSAELSIGVLVLLSHNEPGEYAASRTTAVLLGGVAMLTLIRAVLAPLRGISPNLLSNDPFRFGAIVLYMIFSAGMAFGFVWMMTARLRNQLEVQARTDGLTGALNRRALEVAAQRELGACRRRGTPLAVLAMDLDHFKRLNDAHGHAGGDAVLAAAARLLTRGTRSTDLVARFGGEEFVVVLPDRDAHRAFEIAERLRGEIAALRLQFDGVLLSVTASFGVAAATGGNDDWNELLRRADRALYEAKQGGRNCSRGQQTTTPEPEELPAAHHAGGIL